jgi:hypothetical protein
LKLSKTESNRAIGEARSANNMFRGENPLICAKAIVALVGILIWDATITLTPLLHYFDKINLLRKFSPRCKAKIEWKRPLTLQDEDAAIQRVEESVPQPVDFATKTQDALGFVPSHGR